MNLHGLVRGVITSVNPDVQVGYWKSNGYTQDATFKQVPSYAHSVQIPAQVQALSGKDLRHEALQNIQGVVRAVYLYGNVQGVVRADMKGGDMFGFAQVPGGTVQYWKVVAVLETWPDWCKVAVTLQTDTAAPGP